MGSEIGTHDSGRGGVFGQHGGSSSLAKATAFVTAALNQQIQAPG